MNLWKRKMQQISKINPKDVDNTEKYTREDLIGRK